MFKLEEPLPDVLILPSNLKQFHKVIDWFFPVSSAVALTIRSKYIQVVQGTAVINPSFLSKGVHALLHLGDRRSRSDLENGDLAGVRAQVQLNTS
jgi:hypothetical protein